MCATHKQSLLLMLLLLLLLSLVLLVYDFKSVVLVSMVVMAPSWSGDRKLQKLMCHAHKQSLLLMVMLSLVLVVYHYKPVMWKLWSKHGVGVRMCREQTT